MAIDAADDCGWKSHYFKITSNMQSNFWQQFVFKTEKRNSLMQCTSSCGFLPNCNAFTFDDASKTCEMANVTRLIKPDAESKAVHMEKSSLNSLKLTNAQWPECIDKDIA